MTSRISCTHEMKVPWKKHLHFPDPDVRGHATGSLQVKMSRYDLTGEETGYFLKVIIKKNNHSGENITLISYYFLRVIYFS